MTSPVTGDIVIRTLIIPGLIPKNEEAPHGGERGILRFLWGELMMGREDPSRQLNGYRRPFFNPSRSR